MDVKLMHRQGHSLRHIARLTGMSRVTVRRILSSPAPKGYGPRPLRPSKLDPFVTRLEGLVVGGPEGGGELAAPTAGRGRLRGLLRDGEAADAHAPARGTRSGVARQHSFRVRRHPVLRTPLPTTT